MKIHLDPKDIDEAIMRLKVLKMNVAGHKGEGKTSSAIDRVCKRLAEIGATTMKYTHDVTWSTYCADTGHNESVFTVKKIPEGYSVIAKGTEVLFIEFGAGVTYGSGHPLANGITTGVNTYNPQSGHAMAKQGWWTPEGKHTYGNPPACGIVHAERDMRDAIKQIVEEEFSGIF